MPWLPTKNNKPYTNTRLIFAEQCIYGTNMHCEWNLFANKFKSKYRLVFMVCCQLILMQYSNLTHREWRDVIVRPSTESIRLRWQSMRRFICCLYIPRLLSLSLHSSHPVCMPVSSAHNCKKFWFNSMWVDLTELCNWKQSFTLFIDIHARR